MTDDGYDFRRKHERKEYGTNIVFAIKDRAYSGILRNISVGGAFIATASVNQLSIGEVVTISIPFTDGRKHVRRRARIEWQNNEGFAVEFL
jgi:hypothetical protein